MSKGFSTAAADSSPVDVEVLDSSSPWYLSDPIKLSDSTYSVTLGGLRDAQQPVLKPLLPFPVIFNDPSGTKVASNEYTFREDFREGNGDWEYRLLKAPQEQAGNSFDRHQKNILKFLSSAIATIGGVSFEEVVKGSSYSNKPIDFLKKMPLPNIQMLMFGFRGWYGGGLDYSVRQQCPCPKKALLADCDEAQLHSVEAIEVRYLSRELSGRPVYELELESGYLEDVSGEKFNKLYVIPPTIEHYGKLQEREQNRTITEDMLIELVVGIPDAKFANQTGSGTVFQDTMYRKAGRRVKRELDKKIADIYTGKIVGMDITPMIEFQCPKCPAGNEQKIEFPLFWPLGYEFAIDSLDPRLPE